jgi:hypothetical protein
VSSPDLQFSPDGTSPTSVKTVGQVMSWDGVYGMAPFRGEHTIIPNRRGQRYVPREYDAYTFPVPMILLGSTQADFQDKLRTLQRLIESSLDSVYATRLVGSSGGDITQFCEVQARVGEVGMVNGLLNGRVTLEVTNLDGCWRGAAATPTIPATITNPGTAWTHEITLVLPGAGTLTNTTTGATLVLTGSGSRTLSVHSRHTSGLQSDVSASGDPFGFWFNLAPGSNTITWSGSGTPTISYRPAYL